MRASDVELKGEVAIPADPPPGCDFHPRRNALSFGWQRATVVLTTGVEAMRYRCAVALGVFLVVGTLAGSGLSGPADPLLERELVVYSSIFKDGADLIQAEFKKAYPDVRVSWLNPGGTEAILKRLEAEAAAPRADIMHSGSSLEYQVAKTMRLLQPTPISLEAPAFLRFGGVTLPLGDREGYFYVTMMQWIGLGVNTARLRELNLPIPTSYEDLTKPIYQGLIVVPLPQKSSTAYTTVMAAYHAFGKDRIWGFWDRLDRNIKIYTDSSSLIYTLVRRGEVAILIGGNRSVWRDKADGAPMEFIFPKEGAYPFDNSVGMVRGAPHPYVAQRFIEFHFSRELQAALPDIHWVPVRRDVRTKRPDLSLDVLERQIPRMILPDDRLIHSAEVRAEIFRKFDEYVRRR